MMEEFNPGIFKKTVTKLDKNDDEGDWSGTLWDPYETYGCS